MLCLVVIAVAIPVNENEKETSLVEKVDVVDTQNIVEDLEDDLDGAEQRYYGYGGHRHRHRHHHHRGYGGFGLVYQLNLSWIWNLMTSRFIIRYGGYRPYGRPYGYGLVKAKLLY